MAAQGNQVCAVYGIVRPILKLVEVFFPADWRKSVDEFIAAMDKICPAGASAAAAAGAGRGTFEEVNVAVTAALNQHVAAGQGSTAVAAVNLGTAGAEVCKLYKAIKPILQFVSVFVPGHWQAGILAFIAVFDTLCP
jgi:hypothetical protein